MSSDINSLTNSFIPISKGLETGRDSISSFSIASETPTDELVSSLSRSTLSRLSNSSSSFTPSSFDGRFTPTLESKEDGLLKPLTVKKVPSRKILTATLNSYRAYIEERFNRHKTVCQDSTKVQEDLQKKREYIDVISLMKFFDENDDSVFCFSCETGDQIQGLTVGKNNKNIGETHISALLTAPWNLSMNAPNHTASIQTKGVGRTLLVGIYQLAQSLNMKYISLNPLDNSISFYKTVGMKEKDSGEMILEIQKEIPQLLLKQKGSAEQKS